MSRILITSGPTRQHLDPVRYLTNASTGLMGQALALAAIEQGHDVVLVSGPVSVPYPPEAQLFPVVSTDEMLSVCREQFPSCDGLIAAAAPCDYRPRRVEPRKIHKTGGPLIMELVETEDIVAALAAIRRHQWLVAFALETEDLRLRALAKLERKSCDLIVTNSA
jgi:phosphopantothenoylcysteine decarboxylase/phosphopantothenate--cysteine ligase